jgi:hypothetical protein
VPSGRGEPPETFVDIGLYINYITDIMGVKSYEQKG